MTPFWTTECMADVAIFGFFVTIATGAIGVLCYFIGGWGIHKIAHEVFGKAWLMDWHSHKREWKREKPKDCRAFGERWKDRGAIALSFLPDIGKVAGIVLLIIVLGSSLCWTAGRTYAWFADKGVCELQPTASDCQYCGKPWRE